jgi:hypothetical protein
MRNFLFFSFLFTKQHEEEEKEEEEGSVIADRLCH